MLSRLSNNLNSLCKSVVDFSIQHLYLTLGLLAGTTYILSYYFSGENADICNGIKVSSDGRYFNPANEVCSRLMDKVGLFTRTAKVGIYDRGLWKLATHGDNLAEMNRQYNEGYFVDRDFCEIPRAVLKACMPR